MASMLTVPPFKQNPSYPWDRDPGAKRTMQTLAANTGSAAREVARVDYTDWPSPTMVVGWDRDGPLATLNTSLAAQNAPLSVRYTGAPLIHLASDGSHLGAVAGFNPVLSPDGKRVVGLSQGQVLAQDGSVKTVPGWRLNTWQQVGWIDGQTVVPGVPNGASAHMLLIGVDDANAKPVDLDFSGYFAGVLS
jgi:hypothetical protein